MESIFFWTIFYSTCSSRSLNLCFIFVISLQWYLPYFHNLYIPISGANFSNLKFCLLLKNIIYIKVWNSNIKTVIKLEQSLTNMDICIYINVCFELSARGWKQQKKIICQNFLIFLCIYNFLYIISIHNLKKNIYIHPYIHYYYISYIICFIWHYWNISNKT